MSNSLNSPIICADDFGYRQQINQAVIELGEQDKLSATSVIVDAPHLKSEDIIKLKQLREKKGFAVGLHINLTEIFTNSQQAINLYKKINKFVFTFIRDKANEQAYYHEIDRQFQLFIKIFDFQPDFIDSHQHVHATLPIRSAFIQFIGKKIDNNYQPWIRIPNHMHCFLGSSNLNEKVKVVLLDYLGNKLEKELNHHFKELGHLHLLSLCHLLGVYGFTSSKYSKKFANWYSLSKNKNNYCTVIMVHPASYRNTDVAEFEADPIAKARVKEYQTLRDFKFKYPIL